jgi:diacylglycerol kinase (ATP)
VDEGEPQEMNILILAVANGRFFGGGIPICPAADPADGLLDLVMIRHVPRRRIPLYLPGLMMSRDLRFRVTTHRKAQSVTFEGNNLRVNIDGEIRSMDGAEFRIRPASLQMIRPSAERN